MVAESFNNPPSGVKCSTKLEDVISAKGFDCRIDSGFSWNIIRASPDSNEIQSMCQSARCRVMFESMRAVATTECVTSSGWYLYADLLNPILKGCESLPTPVTTGEAPYNGSASSISTAPPTAVTVTPSANTTTGPTPTVAATTAPSIASTTAPTIAATAAPALVTPSPVITTVAPASATSSSGMPKGSLIVILSTAAVVLSTISAIVKFFYSRRQRKKQQNNNNSNNNNKNSNNDDDDGGGDFGGLI